MKHLNKLLAIAFINLSFFGLTSCEKDEGKLPAISLKTDAAYVSSDVTRPGGSTITIGIEAAKTESRDVLKKFNISKSVNGGETTTVLSKDLSGSDGDKYSYDYTTTLENTPGQVNKYTFTVTNRDGLVNQVSVQATIQ